MIYEVGWQEGLIWVVVLAFIVAFVLGFAMGANDCANSYGPAVGSKVLKLWQAYILATVFEIVGAALLGYKVTNTLRKSIVNLHIYDVHLERSSLTGNVSLVQNCTEPDFAYNYSLRQLHEADKGGCITNTDASFMIGALGALIGESTRKITIY